MKLLRKNIFTPRVFVFLPLFLQQAQPIQVPNEVRGRPGRLIVIEASAANVVRWHACTGSADLDFWSSTDGKTLIVCTPTPGVYQLLAWTAVNGVPSAGVRCTVIVETTEPPHVPHRRDCP
jgi:hypothetical protein